ncbi:glycosyltransferase [uncultured Pseudoteredinibacter sp.]|uniref:glycosyltransferase n=1 Tax=uncultured Pseudoteredinibacter sp. TaxID=1641701 RepID=UPI00261DC0F6|nr:glycosyltransferase [uncultured Pseudoteredinibacter sp.]
MFKPCAVIPVYNHPDTIKDTTEQVLKQGLDVILIDDGSEQACAIVLQKIAQSHTGVQLVRLNHNLGKGGAVKAGLLAAFKKGYSHALQIDADGQHNHLDIPVFLKQAENMPNTLISGLPKYDKSVPKLRFYARYLTHVWIWINTLSLDIKDSMCGFRVYPLARSAALLESKKMGDRMDFDPEFMVRWHWAHPDVFHIETEVQYPQDGISHFRGVEDNCLISAMHAKLFFGLLSQLPRRALKRLKGGNSNG